MERIVEDSVEVVINHLKPYKIGNKSSFTLEEIFKIDTEDTEIVNLGIPDIRGFVVNSLGEIFILRTASGEGDFVFKFDRNGRFIKSFAPQGPGPGEIQSSSYIGLDSEDNILIIDSGKRMILKYDKDGVFIKNYDGRGIRVITSGPKKNLLALKSSFAPENKKLKLSYVLKLLNPDLEEIKVIDKFSYEMQKGTKFRAIEPLFCWSTSHDNIYVVREDRGYEIWVYDFNGKLKRKIRKEYRKIPISEDYRKKILNPWPKGMRERVYFPEFHPALQSMVAGDDGTLLVATFEEGNNTGEFLFDIFNEEGVFIGRKSLNVFIWENRLYAQIKANKFYCLREKNSGYKELVVYNMKWE
ncbi:6-bladed beta-propeller [Candidatus Aminicenantes bacterium AH-873-B07]|nr:6-bladed beta-propeller [Candidatus Aminicenantes bacterium AH-873-B07]